MMNSASTVRTTTHSKTPMSEIDNKTSEPKLKYQLISDNIRNQIVTRFLVHGHKLIDVNQLLPIPSLNSLCE